MIVGVTGSRYDPAQAQIKVLFNQLFALYRPSVILAHGRCTGFDELACRFARKIGYRTRAHPPLNRRFIADTTDDWTAEPQSYPARNAAIVDESAVLVAGPQFPEHDPRSQRSGTWQTVRMARTKGIPIRIIYQDGSIEAEGDWWPHVSTGGNGVGQGSSACGAAAGGRDDEETVGSADPDQQRQGQPPDTLTGDGARHGGEPEQ